MNNCEEQRILDMINKNKKCCRTCFGPTGPKGEQGEIGPTGPTGPTGPIGLSETIEVGETKTGDPGSKASVVDRGGPNHILDFTIPSGLSGLSKIQNAYIIKYNDGTVATGIKIEPDERIPLDRIELDVDNGEYNYKDYIKRLDVLDSVRQNVRRVEYCWRDRDGLSEFCAIEVGMIKNICDD